MRPAVFSADRLRQFLRRSRVATLPQLRELLGTQADAFLRPAHAASDAEPAAIRTRCG